ncbi:carbohydrate ABC transporter permease [Paenibacillus sp. strain BS8-2]
MRTKRLMIDITLFAMALVLAVIFFFPIYFNLLSAFKSNGEILKDALALPKKLYLDSFKYLLTETGYPRAIWNSVLLTSVTIGLKILIIPIAAYAIERSNKRWTNAVFLYFLFGMMIPFQVYMLPLIKELNLFGLYGNLGGPIVVYIAGGVGFGILLYTSFLKGVPREIEEAAEIDGCTRWGIFWRVVFPLLGPVTATMVVLQGLNVWNDFLLPMLVLKSGEPKTMIVEIYNYVGEYVSRWDMIFAGTTMSLVPVLIAFVFLQKYFIKGVATGSVKG